MASKTRKYRIDKDGQEKPVWASPSELRELGTAEGRAAFEQGRLPIRMSNTTYDDAAEREHARLTEFARKFSETMRKVKP